MNLENILNKLDNNIQQVLNSRYPAVNELFKAAGLAEGKRLRSRLFFLLAQEDTEQSLQIATALELVHAATLIHDDILDNALSRRGKSTLYINQGIPVSLLYGDYLFSSAFSLVAGLEDNRLYKMFTDSVQVTLLGEIQERSCLCDFTLTRADYIDIISKKSGALFALATKAAAIVSQRIPEYELDKYYQCGLNLGIAYQITDDFFDYFAHHTNKDKYCDLRQGVITLPLIYLLKKASISEQEELKGLIMQNKLTNKEIAKVTCLMYKYQVVDLVLFDLQYFTDKAKKILPGDLAVSRKVVEFINLIERKITRVGNHSAFYLHS